MFESVDNKEIQIESVRKAIAFDLIYDFDKVKKEYDEQEEFFEGHRKDKRFVRVDSKCFQTLIDELTNNPDCGYYTYANDVIKEGFVLKKLSCLLKQLKKSTMKDNDPHEMLSVREVLSSEILNFYGCPTVYNAPIVVKDIEGNDEYKILSVDVVNSGKELQLLSEYNCGVWRLIEDCMDRIVSCLEKLNLNDADKRKFLEDFVTSHLLRQHILIDFDYSCYNVGIIDNKLLNFDYELSFNELNRINRNIDYLNMQKNLGYIYKNFPSAYNKLKEKTSVLINGLHQLIDTGEFIFANDTHEHIVKEVLYPNLEYLNTAFYVVEEKLNPIM